MRKLKSWRSLIRPGLLLVTSASLAILSTSLLWLPFALLAAFFVAIDVFTVDRNGKGTLDMQKEFDSYQPGVLGEYVIDSTNFFGLFLVLLSKPIFVDIRRDEFFEERKRHALFLFQSQDALGADLAKFLESNPEYSTRRITSIGLHSRVMDQGEVFWEPEGYTQLRGLRFLQDAT